MQRSTGFRLAGGLCWRGLGLVYAIAFASLGVQALGLYGARGILPVAELLPLLRERLGPAAMVHVPTLFWLDASDPVLGASCWIGVAIGLALAAGLAPKLCAALCWALYLSWCQVGQVFLGFQWDALLLETGLLAIWLAPAARRVPLGRLPDPPAEPLWLLRWLVFRLFLLSGLVKLLSGDPAWRDLSAMAFHQWTQPLPNPLSPFVHALPLRIHEGETLATFAVELGLPWLVFAPAPLPRVAAAGFCALLAAINLTGNYGFFGPLAALLCVPLVDDAVWRRVPGLRALPTAVPRATRSPLRRALAGAAVAFVVIVTSGAALLRIGFDLPAPWQRLLAWSQPLDSFHAYGLFAVMTKDRAEIELEGSLDGESWRSYEFRWKPDRVDEPPPIVPFHMPRLDWQMWFAALEDCGSNGWFLAFQRRLLQASPEVLGLLARDPFAGRTPRFVRSSLARYRFADRATRRRTGDWWTREPLGPYCPTLELGADGRLGVVR